MQQLSETIEWHRAEDVLPGDMSRVLVVSELPGARFATYSPRGWCTYYGVFLTEVRYWAELPQGPQP